MNSIKKAALDKEWRERKALAASLKDSTPESLDLCLKLKSAMVKDDTKGVGKSTVLYFWYTVVHRLMYNLVYSSFNWLWMSNLVVFRSQL